MSSSPSVPERAPAAALCETVARALHAVARVVVHAREGDVEWSAAGDARAAALDDALRIPFGDDEVRGTLHVARVAGGAPWTPAERELAASFAPLATVAVNACAAPRLRARLAELERHVDQAQALASLGSFEYHVDEDRITWSPEQRRIHGLGAGEGPRTFADFFARIHPDDRARATARMEELRSHGTGGDAHYRIVRPDGEVRHVHARTEVVRDASGRVVRMVGTVQDVTRLREAEQELRAANEALEQRVAERTASLHASEAQFRRLIEHAHDAIVIVDEDGVARYGSPSVRALFGYDPAALVGQSLVPLLHPDDLASTFAWLHGLGDHPGAVQRHSYRFRHADGRWLHLEAASMPTGEYRARAGHVINIRDVTERVAAERALAESQAHFRRLIEHAHDLLVIVGEDGSAIYGSPSVQHILGYDPEDYRGQSLLPFLHEEDAPRVAAWLHALAAEPGTPQRLAFRFRHARGHWVHLEGVGTTGADYEPGMGLVLNLRDVSERVAAERALMESEEHFRRLIEHSYDLVQVLGADGRVIYTGPSVTRLLGYTPEEVAGGGLADYIHPDDLAAAVALVTRVLEQPGRAESLEYRVRHKDGSWRWLEAWARTLSPTSAAQGLVANARDITERKEAEQAVRVSEERYRALVEQLPGIIYTTASLEPGYPTTFVSPQAEQLLGTKAQEWYDDPQLWLKWVHEDDRERVRAAWEAAHAAAAPFFAEYRMRTRDGRVLWFRDQSGQRRDAEGRPMDIQGVMVDVTERKEAEFALQRSEEHFRRLIENTSDIVTVVDVHGNVAYQSPSAHRLMGWPPESRRGKPTYDLMHPDDLPRVQAALAEVLRNPGTTGRVSYRMRHADGTWRVFESVGRTILPDSPDGGVVVSSRDVTEREEAEAALARAREDAERANRAKSEFLSRMSHELRTPLNSILGFAQVLQDVEMPPEYRTGVRHILNGGRHLLNLINEVLDIARIEAEQQQLAIEPVSVGAAIAQAVDMVRPLAAAHGVPIVVADAEGHRYVRADRQRLTQVLLNLLSNAIKYNRPQGTVRVECAMLDDDGVGARVRIRIADEGTGIAPGRRDQLFVPFARLGAEQTGIEGTGLGLALSQRLAQAMGGALVLERSDAGGSVFAIDLVPSDEAHGALVSGGTPTSSMPAVQHAALILYVEDNLANLSLVETILLTRPAWCIMPAMQGQTGLELAREHAPDVVLLDLHLPDIKGETVLRELRADPRTAEIPVVVITADATPRTADALRAQGADAFLTKPLDVSAFLQTVEQAIARRR